jgi:SNF2 family DNA or RNA helicase
MGEGNSMSIHLHAPSYRDFLEGKIKLAGREGFHVEPDELHPWLKPHVKAIVPWMLSGGRRALFANFGLAKTSTQLELMRLIKKHRGGHMLIVLPLGVRQEFKRDAETMGIRVKFIRRPEEIDAAVDVHLTNYETIREGKLDPALFTAASLDEASVLRDYGSKTYQEFLPLFEKVPFRFVATATPSPNRFKELIHYAGFLGIMDTGQALTRFFQRDSEKAGNLTLYPHKAEEFFVWLASWSLWVQRPSEVCRCACHAMEHSHGL